MSKTRQRFNVATTGDAPGNQIGKPSARFYAKGGVVKTQAFAQVKGARAGYAHRTGKSKP